MFASNFIVMKKQNHQNHALWGQPEQNGTWGLLTNLVQKNTGGQKKENAPGLFQMFQHVNGQAQQQNRNKGLNLLAGGLDKITGNHLQGKEWIAHQQNKNKHSIERGNNVDILKMLTEQVIQVQASPSEQKLQEIKKKGQKFIDDRFLPNVYSLSGQWGQMEAWKDIKWAKISQKSANSKIFVDKPEPKDIKQGYLGDCYFLAGLAAISQRPDRIYNLFMITQRNEEAHYQIKMLFKGKWITIDMDQYIPYMNSTFAFSKAVSNELWVPLLQKAWAKMYSSYKRIDSGYPEEPLHDLTGAPIKQIFLKTNFNKEQQWNYLLKGSKLQYPMVCSSNAGSDTNKSQSGVVQGHAYTLLSVDLLRFQGKEVRLVKLRNPWGRGQFKGEWSDDDPNWLKVDESQKKRLGYEKAQDGIFFIPYDKFCDEFRSITIAQVHDGASYMYKSFKDTQGNGCYFKMEVQQQGAYSLQIDKTPERSFEDQLQNQYNYPMATVQVGTLQDNSYKKIDKFKSANRMTQQKFKLKKGVYIVKVLIDFDLQWQKDFDVNLAVYSEFPSIISYASNKEASLLAGKSVKWDPTNVQNHMHSGVWNQLAGYGWAKGFKNMEKGEKEAKDEANRRKPKRSGFCCFG